MCDRNHQIDMSHTLSAYFLFSYFDTTTITNNTSITDTLIFTTVTFIIFNRSKNTLTKQTITFWFICSVIYCFWFQNFTTRLFQNKFWRSQTNSDIRKTFLLRCIIFPSHSHILKKLIFYLRSARRHSILNNLL